MITEIQKLELPKRITGSAWYAKVEALVAAYRAAPVGPPPHITLGVLPYAAIERYFKQKKLLIEQATWGGIPILSISQVEEAASAGTDLPSHATNPVMWGKKSQPTLSETKI